MAVFRINKTRDYTVMSNYHLKDTRLSLKSKGLLSMMLSLPEEWNYTTRGLAAICKEGVDSIGTALKELECSGYIQRNRVRDEKGKITDTEYIIFEKPQEKPDAELQDTAKPYTENPYMDKPDAETPCTENTTQLNTNIDYKYDGKNMTENGVSYVWLLEKEGDTVIVIPPANTEEKHTHDFRYLETVAPSCGNLG